jgi:3-deoxy-D-manno-octulosonate 8-phosphate phosphatase (KDO 8-P phosphatase)
LNPTEIIDLFAQQGCKSYQSEWVWAKKIGMIKAFLFDWDGVFHSGSKGPSYPGTFSEEDSMGLNMLRFAHYLKYGGLPYVGIISGEDNPTASFLAKRECLDGVYFKAKNKIRILDHLKSQQGISPEEICFVYDDILDLSLAKEVGIRVLITRESSPLFSDYCEKHQLTDFETSTGGGYGGTRQFSEFYLGLAGQYDQVIEERIAYGDNYKNYLHARAQVMPKFYLSDDESFKLVDH